MVHGRAEVPIQLRQSKPGTISQQALVRSDKTKVSFSAGGRKFGETLTHSDARRLPDLQYELRSKLASTRAELARLPEQTKNHVAKAAKIIRDFLGAVEKHLEGAPGKDGLHQSIRQPFHKFTTAIRASAPDFRPYPSSSKAYFLNVAIRPYEGFVVKDDKIIYLDEVKELASM